MGKLVKSHADLDVYRKAFDAAMQVFELSKAFPKYEIFSLTDQMWCAARSVCANLAEAWRKRRYRAAFLSKLCECESEAAECQVWIEFSVKCDYLSREQGKPLYVAYDEILRMLVSMRTKADRWLLNSP